MFSGIGGFEYGMQQSEIDFEGRGHCEVDQYAESIYSRHFPTSRNFGDATKIKTSSIPRFDFLVAGFPCQAFSTAGLRRGFDDTRGTLFFEIARVLKDKRPRYFLLENVRGLLHHEEGKTFQKILEVLSDLGYYVKWEVHNSKSYSVPQNRERIFIKGYSRKECGREVLLVGGTDTEATNEGEIIKVGNFLPSNFHSKNVYSKEGISPALCSDGLEKNGLHIVESDNLEVNKVGNISPSHHWRGDVLDTDGVSRSLTCNDYKQPVIIKEEDDNRRIEVVGNVSATNHYGGTVFSPNGLCSSLLSSDYKHYKNVLVEEEEDYDDCLKVRESTKKGYKEAYPYDGVLTNRAGRKVMKGIVRRGECGCLQTNGVWATVTKDFKIRRLTPRECERLQGFPDDWTLYGKDGDIISDTQRYKCIGNAVTTTVITAIVNEMFKNREE